MLSEQIKNFGPETLRWILQTIKVYNIPDHRAH